MKSAKVVTDGNGESRGYGFVRFLEESEQKDALRGMQGAMGLGRKVRHVCACQKVLLYRTIRVDVTL